MFSGKRELLARGLYWSGAPFLFDRLPARDLLLVLNYHRIGNRDDDLFDPNVFSATADDFNEQISYLKHHVDIITLEEAQAFVEGTIREKTPRFRVLITFDDGYLDNYKLAFPILRSHGVPGVFFLVTGIMGSSWVPWWDHVAFLMKTARQTKFSLRYPVDLSVDIDENGITKSLMHVLRSCARPDNTDGERFIRELKESCQGREDFPRDLRRFLNWDEAREMLAAGMAVGSHTHSHPVLSQLKPEEQRQELIQSRALLKQNLGIEAKALAYPVGGPTAFTDQTQSIAQETGYRMAFSFSGGVNFPGKTAAHNVKRISGGYQSQLRFKVQTSMCRMTGEYWP